MTRSWSRARGVFSVVAGPPGVWLTAFFLVPLAIIWAFSFGESTSLTQIGVTGTFANYARHSPALSGHHLEIALVRRTDDSAVPDRRFPSSRRHHLRKREDQGLAAVADHAAVLDQSAHPHLCADGGAARRGYVNITLAFMWNGVSHLTAALGHPLPPFQPLQLLHNNFAVVFGLVYVQLPFMVLPLYAALDRLDRSLLEASLDLGAGHVGTFAPGGRAPSPFRDHFGGAGDLHSLDR